MPWHSSGYMRVMPPLTWQCDPQIDSVLERVPPGARVVDLGAGGRVIRPGHIRIDLTPCANTTVVGDGECMPLLSGSVDLCIATGLLEHVRHMDKVLDEMARVIRPGGIVHIELPFMQQYHADPIDVRRLTLPGLEMELQQRQFTTIRKGVHIGPTVTVITLGAYYLSLLFLGRSTAAKAISSAVFFGWSALAYPLKFLDWWLVRKPDAHRIAFGVYCTSRLEPAHGSGR